jgi:hypothetical protein
VSNLRLPWWNDESADPCPASSRKTQLRGYPIRDENESPKLGGQRGAEYAP